MCIKKSLPLMALLATLLATLPGACALSVNLTLPAAGYSSPSKNVTFGCNATDENLTGITLFLWDSEDVIYYNDTRYISGTFSDINWTVNDTVPGNYYWSCLAYDNESNYAWSASNRTLHVNLFYLFETSTENDNTRAIALGDLDNDGDLDYIAGNYLQPTRIYLNNGSGHFSLSESTQMFLSTQSIAIGDLDNDGDMDFIEGNYDANNSVYLNNGTGHFVFHENMTAGTGNEYTWSVALGDFDSDGDLDCAVANSGGGSPLQVFSNDGYGNFTFYESQPGITNFYALSVGDFNGDTYPDIAATAYAESTTIYFNNGTGYFTTKSVLSSQLYSRDISSMDLNNDGYLDLLDTSDRNFENNSVFLNDGNGTFSNISRFGQTNETYSVALGDVDNDGDIDAVSGIYNGQNYVFTNDGTGYLKDSSAFEVSSTGSSTTSIFLGDLDNDGDLDYIAGNNGNNSVFINQIDNINYVNVYVKGSGTAVSRDATGTKVQVADATGTFKAFREVTAGDISRNGPSQLHFGLTSGVTYTINATFITGKIVSCLLEAPNDFIMYENGSSTNGVYCDVVDFSPQIVSMTPQSGNVTTSLDVNFTCNASDDNMLSSMSIMVWNSTNDLYDQAVSSTSGVSSLAYLVSQSMPPDTYRWNCRACDNVSKCASAEENYTLSVLIMNRLGLKLWIDGDSGMVHIPGEGEVGASEADYQYGRPPHFYLASYSANAVTGLAFVSRVPRLIDTRSSGGKHYIALEQDLEGSQVLLAFTGGDWRAIENRITSLEKGTFLQNPLPSFAYGLGKDYSAEISLFYGNIDLFGKLRLNKGVNTIKIENNGTYDGKPQITLARN